MAELTEKDGFSRVFEAELKAIGTKKPEVVSPESGKPTAALGLRGLALSGGGIRSATFSLGVMQALAGAGLLGKFHYMSTVSGGGYMGSALTWLTGAKSPEEPLPTFGLGPEDFPFGTGDPAEPSDSDDLSDSEKMLRFLRQHGNYLTPGNGITLMSGIVVVLRGVVLNLMVWLPLFVAVLWLLLAIGPALVELFPVFEKTHGLFTLIFFGGVALALVIVAAFLIYSLRTRLTRRKKPANRYGWRRGFEKCIRRILVLASIMLVVGSIPEVHSFLGEQFREAGGLGAFLVGGCTSVWAFMRTAKKKGGVVPIGVIASVAVVLVTFGLVLICYQTAFWVYSEAPVPTWSSPRFVVFAVLFVVALVTGRFVNLNHITLNRFYRDRLMETFLPDIGSALNNDTGPAVKANRARLHEVWRAETSRGPYPLINTNVVLVDSDDRTRQNRGGDNFILSPLYCGGEAMEWWKTEDFKPDGREKGSMTLATAMAISGAAANPDTGVGGSGLTRSPVVSFLMAFFNVRLGYWAANPGKEDVRRPVNHFDAARAELGIVGPAGYREDCRYIQLSDGGHFENLGLYELIRRRVKLIVAVDASADREFSFGDLQVALRRCAQDFGVRIEFPYKGNKPNDLIPVSDAGYPVGSRIARKGHIVGRIIYPDGDEPGTLIFIKTVMIKRLRLEVKGYRGANPDFPDQSTADQFFDDEQFEAYRELGYRIAGNMIRDLETSCPFDAPGLRDFIPLKSPNGGSDERREGGETQ